MKHCELMRHIVSFEWFKFLSVCQGERKVSVICVNIPVGDGLEIFKYGRNEGRNYHRFSRIV